MIPIAQIKLPPAKSANRFTGERRRRIVCRKTVEITKFYYDACYVLMVAVERIIVMMNVMLTLLGASGFSFFLPREFKMPDNAK